MRLFLKQLGYEKYASIFEESKIGMLELPYLTEDRLEKLGIPTGPRMKIFQEAKANGYGGGINQLPSMHAAGASGAPSAGGNQQQQHALPVQNHSAAATVAGGVSSNPNEQNYNVYIL